MLKKIVLLTLLALSISTIYILKKNWVHIIGSCIGTTASVVSSYGKVISCIDPKTGKVTEKHAQQLCEHQKTIAKHPVQSRRYFRRTFYACTKSLYNTFANFFASLWATIKKIFTFSWW